MPDNPDASSFLVPIGRLTKAHGIRGELVLVLEADSADLVSGELFLKPKGVGEDKQVRVERTRFHHGNLLVSFAGISTRNEAELLRQHRVFIPKDRLPPLEEGELYLSDLPGLRVFVAAPVADDAGEAAVQAAIRDSREIGRILAIDVPAGQELWTILTPDGREILFPAVDPFILSLDVEEGMAVISPPPGLLELYLLPS